ncbi:hypothetical protein ACO0R3_002429 [Hanseniaspora guilliermondii]
MFIKFILPKSNHFRNYITRTHKINYSTDQPVNNVKNIRLYNFLMRYKFIQKLYTNPKYDHYFHNLFNTSTKSVIVSFMILHELTATIPFVGLWYLLYQKFDYLAEDFKDADIDCLYHVDDPNKETLGRKIEQFMKKSENAVKRFIGKFVDTEDLNSEQIKFLTVTGVVSYVSVKAIAPIRIMLSVIMTPKLANILQKGFNKLFK